MYGKRLKDAREDNDLTQKEVADKIGVGLRTYQKYESEEIEPKMSAFEILANTYNCTIDYLLGRTEHPREGISEFSINGHNVKVNYDKSFYPDGLNKETFIKLLKDSKDIEEAAKNILNTLNDTKSK